jgi:hypothetical protein
MEHFWTSEGEENDILQDFLRNERAREESDTSLHFLGDIDALLDIELTDTNRLFQEPLIYFQKILQLSNQRLQYRWRIVKGQFQSILWK